MRGIARRLRSSFGIRSSRMAIRSQLAWYWRWLLNLLMMVAVGGVVWWLVENSHRITGFNREEAKQQLVTLAEDNVRLKRDSDAIRAQLNERERQLQIEKASQSELAKSVAQLQEENAALKEDLGFLRNIMSSVSTPEGLSLANVKVEPEGQNNEYRYRMLLTQGGQRKQDFRGRVQILAKVSQNGAVSVLPFPDDAAIRNSPGDLEFRFYQKVEGRFKLPDGTVLKSIDIRVFALPGGQVKLSRTIGIS
jgi:hypothetical protein